MVVASAQAFAAPVFITNFGNSTFTENGGSTFGFSQTASSISLTGIEGDSLYGDVPVQVDISSQLDFLSIEGNYTGTYNGQFNIELFDADGDSRLYTASFASFTPSVSSSVTAAFAAETGTFNGNVLTIGFSASGFGSDTTNITLTNLTTAVPEPTTWALFATGLAAAMVFRARRRRS